MTTHGVIYYNRGTSCAARLMVSTYTLRQYYNGPLAILSEGQESHELVDQIADVVNASVERFDLGLEGKNAAYLTKTRLHEVTPFDISLFIDADTIITGPVDELFSMIEEHTFIGTHMANWSTSKGLVAKRIKAWGKYYPDLIQPALDYGDAINTGIFGFTRTAPLIQDWFKKAISIQHQVSNNT